MQTIARIDVGLFALVLRPERDLMAGRVAIERDFFRSKLARARPGPVLLDLCACRMIDSQGIALVIGLQRECQKLGRAVQIALGDRSIARIFTCMQLDRVLDLLLVDPSAEDTD